MAKGLTNKQQAFISQYLVDFNATQAAIRAGYSEDTAYSQGQRLLKHVEVKVAIDNRKKDMLKDADSIIYGNIAYWKSVLDDESVSHAVRLKASEYLGKYGAMFTEKIDVVADVKVSAEIDLSNISKEARKELRDAVD